MFQVTYNTAPGNERFAPTVAHPGEDAGADVRVCIDRYNQRETRMFCASCFNCPPVAAANIKPKLFIDGIKVSQSDLKAKLSAVEASGGGVQVAPGQRVLVNTGFRVILPSAKELTGTWSGLVPMLLIVPRSGLACNHGIDVSNSPGVIDSGYRDWVKVSLTNTSQNYHVFTHGARIAQAICTFAVDMSNVNVTTDEAVLGQTSRALGGFGSTSVN
jgi:dUTP pyrophosphatase